MNTDVDLANGKFSGIGCLLMAISIVLIGIGCSVSNRIKSGKPIIVIQHIDQSQK